MKTTVQMMKALALLSVLAVSAATLAGHHRSEEGMHDKHPMRHMGGERMIERMTEKLDLTAQQQEQVRAIHDEYGPQMRALHKKLWESRQTLHDAVKNGASDADIEQMATAQGELHSELIVLHAKLQRRIRNVLTEEQRVKAEAMREDMKERHQHWYKDGYKDQNDRGDEE